MTSGTLCTSKAYIVLTIVDYGFDSHESVHLFLYVMEHEKRFHF